MVAYPYTSIGWPWPYNLAHNYNVWCLGYPVRPAEAESAKATQLCSFDVVHASVVHESDIRVITAKLKGVCEA